jgi:hypothetical protein
MGMAGFLNFDILLKIVDEICCNLRLSMVSSELSEISSTKLFCVWKSQKKALLGMRQARGHSLGKQGGKQRFKCKNRGISLLVMMPLSD